jgi:hypothetical protein
MAVELSDARRRGLAVLPYVRQVIARSPQEYLDLVGERDRARFGLPSTDGVDGAPGRDQDQP